MEQTKESLLATLREGTQADIARRLRVLEKYAEDFEVGDALLELSLTPPWTSDGSKPLWKVFFALVARTNNPRLKEAKPEWAVRPLIKGWLSNGWKRAVSALPTRDALSPARRKQLEAHERAKPVTKAVGAKGATDDALLAAVYAAPDDDTPRRVYADFLLERGDPRGEFISLQLANRDAAKQKALLKKYGKQWLGALSEAIGADYEFRRGFLSKATIKFRNKADFEKWGPRPEWATVEELDFAGRATVPDGQAEFIYAITPAMKALRRAYGVERPAIVDVKTPWALEVLSVTLENEEFRALFESKMFPRLHTLELSPERFAEAAFFKSLKRIGAVKHFIARARVAGPIPALASRLPFETLTLNGVVYRRDAHGKLSNPDAEPKAPPAGFPAFGWVDGLHARRDGTLTVVTDKDIWHVDSSGERVLNVTSRNLTESNAQWFNTVFTSDGRVIGTCFKAVTVTDPASGAATLFKAPSVAGFYRSATPLSDDERRVSVMGSVVFDLEKRMELKAPNGAGKAHFISPDQTWWVLLESIGSGRFQAVLQRAGSRATQALEGAIDLTRWSFAKGRLFGENDAGLFSYDAATGQRLAFAKEASVENFQAGGTLFTSRRDGRAQLHDAATLKARGRWKGTHAAVTPDGKHVWVSEVDFDKPALKLVCHPLKG